jgi:hypothetical protein
MQAFSSNVSATVSKIGSWTRQGTHQGAPKSTSHTPWRVKFSIGCCGSICVGFILPSLAVVHCGAVRGFSHTFSPFMPSGNKAGAQIDSRMRNPNNLWK